jgi:hypothetical protein
VGRESDALAGVSTRAERRGRVHDGELLMRLRKPRDPDPHAAALAEIDAWERWFHDAQLATIAANPDMHDAERAAAIVAAKSLAAAVAERRRYEYLTWQNRGTS